MWSHLSKGFGLLFTLFQTAARIKLLLTPTKQCYLFIRFSFWCIHLWILFVWILTDVSLQLWFVYCFYASENFYIICLFCVLKWFHKLSTYISFNTYLVLLCFPNFPLKVEITLRGFSGLFGAIFCSFSFLGMGVEPGTFVCLVGKLCPSLQRLF